MAMNRSYPRQRRRAAGWLLPVFAGLSLGGCGTAHMALPQSLQGGSSELAVEGRQLLLFGDSFRIGPYSVTDVHRGWTQTEGSSASTGGSELSSARARQKYRFSVNEPDRPAWAVQCVNTAGWSRLDTEGLLGGRFGVEFAADRQLACTFQRDGGGTPARLVMAESLNRNTGWQGAMRSGDTQIEISATHGVVGTPLHVGAPTGYIFRIDDRTVGAVEVINAGTVWVDNAVPPETRSALAATSAVLLLYQDIGD
jgi:hypothetical protein